MRSSPDNFGRWFPISEKMAEDGAAASEAPAAAGDDTAKSKPAKPAATLEEMFKAHASKASGAEATSADISKWCKDAGVVGKTCDSGHVDISFTKVKQKAAKLVHYLLLLLVYIPRCLAFL